MLSLTEVVDLRDPKMLRELLESGPQLWHTCIDSFPPAPARQATSGIINVGELVYEDLQREQLSLSSLNIGGNKVWQKEIYFWVDPSEELQAGDKLRLVAVDIYPPASNFRPEISLTHDQNTLERGIVLSVGETHSLQLGIIFPMKFKGSLNRVVSLDLMLQKNIGSFATKTIRYKVGFLLLGDVVSKTASHLQDAQLRPKIELSVEAPPFIPISNIIRFDQELVRCFLLLLCFHFTSSSYPRLILSLQSMPWTDPTALSQIMPKPHNFAKSLTIVDPFRFVSEELYRGYVEAFQQNRLPELVLRYGLNHLNQILANDSLLAVSTVEYMRTLGILAVLEEMQTRLDIAKFDLNFVPIKFAIESDSHFTILLKCKIHVPGSSESRPRVLIGDHIRIRPVKEDLATLHIPLFELIAVVTNYVLATEEATCLVSMQKFCPIEALENVRYDVRFSYDNSSFSFTHYLLQRNTVLSKHFLDAIFPTVALFDKLNQYRKLHPLRDHSMEKTASIRREYGSFNAEQERAIQNIVDWTDLEYPKGFKPPILPPFVIFGPPGTGKTRTVTESILRIIGEYPEKRILVCAPSDAAADVIAIRLCKSLGSDQLFRLNWWQRMLTSLPSMLLPYSYQAGDMFELPTTDILKKFQVVVSTCSSAGIFMSEWSRVDFDVVIVDEASQATESEVRFFLQFTTPKVLSIWYI